MLLSTQKRVPAILTALGGGLVGVAGVKNLLDDVVSIPELVYATAALLGAALLGAAGAWVIVTRISLPDPPEFFVRPARRGQLPQLKGFAEEVIDAELLSLEALRAQHRRRPEFLQLVTKYKRRRFGSARELVGFFSVVPITAEAKQWLEQPRLNGFRIAPRHITPLNETPAALYISSIGANGITARAKTLEMLKGYIAALTPTTPLVFTRPVTEDGLRTAKRNGFTAVSKGGPPYDIIYGRDFSS